MRSSWIPTLLLALVVGLLTAFGALQYSWLLKAGQAERERMQRRVETDSKALADEFNREIQAAFFNFRIDAKEIAVGGNPAFAERYEYWRTKTAYPDLIRSIKYYPLDRSAAVLSFIPETRSFKADEPDPGALAVRSLIAETPGEPFLTDAFALVMRIHRMPEKMEHIVIRRGSIDSGPKLDEPPVTGDLVISLDRDVVIGQMLPSLRDRFFLEGEYRISIADREGSVVYGEAAALPDASTGLFSLKPDTMIFLAERELSLPRQPAVPSGSTGIAATRRVEQRVVRTAGEPRTAEEGNKFTIQLKKSGGDAAQTTMVSATERPAPWILSAVHTAGSIDAFITSERQTSIVIGLAIYAILVVAIAAIFLSSVRARVFARRQMEFVSSVSHEFRTPIAVIRSAGENLEDGVAADDRQVERYGGLIKEESRKLARMVEQILEFAGARSGRRAYRFDDVRIDEVVGYAVAECTSAVGDDRVRIVTNVASGLPSIRADRTALSQAVCNLITNSIKYSNGSESVYVSASNGGGSVKLTVQDRGLGISKGDLRKIFEPFYRSKAVVDAQIHGNGLGLSLVRDIVRAHNGRVYAESELGKGSTFTVELPIGVEDPTVTK
jgi:signal transduction histidine kinase